MLQGQKLEGNGVYEGLGTIIFDKKVDMSVLSPLRARGAMTEHQTAPGRIMDGDHRSSTGGLKEETLALLTAS